ncbi:hypothetical protein PG996_008741 [Apiospora saccharicola]|uniref:Clr5 domain-containing protein n=1 Tax=Apiospora saccharicola TaxID=335842 RepID=A0ABR1UYS9_9PEZI
METPNLGAPETQDLKIWRQYEQQLRELLVVKRLTLPRLMETMEAQYGWPRFKRREYIRAFKELNLSRNIPHEHWKVIDDQIRQRELEGKDTEVLMHGAVVSDKKLRKESIRHFYRNREKASGSFPSVNDINGLVIRTPPPLSPFSPSQDVKQTSSMVEPSSTASDGIFGLPAQLSPVTDLTNKSNADLVHPEHTHFRDQIMGNTDLPLNSIDHQSDSGYGSLDTGKNSKSGIMNGETPFEATLTTIDESGDQDEIQTVYSDTESIDDPAILDYIAVFADELVRSLPSGFDATEFERVSLRLDELLQAFSVIIGGDGSTPERRKLMYLVHRYRKKIIAELEQLYAEPPARHSVDPNQMSVEEKISVLWGERDENVAPMELDILPDVDITAADSNDEDDDNGNDDESLPDLDNYRAILYQTSAFQWLGSRVSAADRLDCPGPFNTQTQIRGLIMKAMVPQKRFSRTAIKQAEIEYRLDWNLCGFHIEQQYSCPVEDVLIQSITITGFGNDVQAVTCFAYIEQTWGDTGICLLHTLQRAVKDSLPVDQEYGHARLDATTTTEATIDVSYTRGDFVVVASGLPYPVAEIGEILAWLTAALRQSPERTTVAACRPVVSSVLPRTSGESIQLDDVGPITTGVCRIGVTFLPHDYEELDPSTRCWLRIFRNPVIVNGYPIPRRSQAGSGLEVSLQILISLANAKYMVAFNRRTQPFTGIYHNSDLSYISYEDPSVPRIRENESSLALNDERVLRSRHILGWCRNVSNFTGTRAANYDIKWSGLSNVNSSIVFDRVSVTAGKIANVGGSMTVGTKDNSEQISYEDDYLSTLILIRDRYFVFYDITAQQAWFVDGARAVLHLMRAFIRRSKNDVDLADHFIFDEDDLNEAPESHKGNAAFFVLSNPTNQLLRFWAKVEASTTEMSMKLGAKAEETIKLTAGHFCFKDRVMQICRVLQQITAHQDDIYTRDGFGFRVKASLRRHLVGFDFMDVATQAGTLWSVGHKISAKGQGWVDFARELHSVVLLGRDFGHLMKPKGQPCSRCMLNILHDPEPDLLHLTVRDMHNIMEKRRGPKKGSTWRIVGNIHWYVPDKLHEVCGCNIHFSKKRDRVQVFLPSRLPNLWGRSLRDPQPQDGGAILVGHSFAYPLRWGTRSVPEEGEPEVSDDDDDHIVLQDSGIGSRSSSHNTVSFESARSEHQSPPFEARRDYEDGPSSSTGLFMHENTRFLHQSRSSGTNPDTSNRELLASTGSSLAVSDSNTSYSPSYKGKGKETESVRSSSVETRFQTVGTATPGRPSSSRPSGNYTSQWLSYNKTKGRNK